MSTTCGASAPRWRSRGSVPSCPRRAEPVARELSSAVARFATLLRRSGLPVTLVEVTDAVRALDHLDIADRQELYLGLRAVFLTRPEEAPPFDRCFEAFWRVARDAAREPHARRPHRAPLSGAEAEEDQARPALRRLGLDGPLQPLPAPVPLRPPERLRPGGNLHLLDSTHARHRIPARALLPGGAAAPDGRARLVGRDSDRRIDRPVQPRVAAPRGSADDRDHPLGSVR